MSDLEPITRREVFLNAIAEGGGEVPEPVTREEVYLKAILDNGGGGGGGDVTGVKGSAESSYRTGNVNITPENLGLGTASVKNVPTSGDAGSQEVVLGNDSRLTDARNAKDVQEWAKAETKPTYTANEVGAIPVTEKGVSNGVATLTEAGKVPEAQLPSYVDDAIEGYLYEGHFYADSAHTEEITGERGKIYVDLDTNRAYRWTGSTFVEIGDNNTFTANRALVSDANGKVSASSATSEEVGYLSGVTGAIQTQIDGKADENEATPVSVSGNPITITDAANIPCESLNMTIEPIQLGSGTPSPTNVRPITGLTEATAVSSQDSNLVQLSQFTGDHTTVTINNDKLTLYENGTHAYAGAQIGTAQTTPFSAGSYFVSFTVEEISNLNTGFCVFGLRNSQYTFPLTASISLDHVGEYKQILTIEESCYLSIILNELLAENEIIFSNIRMVKVANTATITFGETVYGGNVDFDTGVVTCNIGYKEFDGSSDEQWDAGGGSAAAYSYRIDYPNDITPYGITQDNIELFKSNRFQTILSSETWGNYDYFMSKNNNTYNIVIGNKDLTDINDFKTWLSNNPVQVVYELATPIEIQLTPTQLTLLKGYNTVSANGATINLDYQKDNLVGDIKKWVIEHFG